MSPLLQATTPLYFKASVTGTIKQELVIGGSQGKIITTPVTSSYIYAQLNASKSDYALVFDFTNDQLILLPRSSSSGKSTLKAFTLDFGSASLVSTETKTLSFVSTLSSTATSNVFENISGSATGAAHYKGPYSGTPDFTSINFTVNATGTDTSSAILSHPAQAGRLLPGDFHPEPVATGLRLIF
ncbi:MAG: hypothetical protein QM796_12335 [Chthoniobacteraceae bacterium]